MKGTAIYRSPVGAIQLEYEDGEVVSLRKAEEDAVESEENALAALVFRQLDEYFAGTRRSFDFPCRAQGTPFQRKVWAALRDIPYGETRTYGDIARQSDSRKPPARSAWRTIATPSISRLPVTASLARTAVWSATAAVWP